MDKTSRMERLYSLLPKGRENAAPRETLARTLGVDDRYVRQMLQVLRAQDNGDGYVIAADPNGMGYYLSDDPAEVLEYARQVEARAEATRAPLKKARRLLAGIAAPDPEGAPVIHCRLAELRGRAGLKQAALVIAMRAEGCAKFDHVALSKAEQGSVILPPRELLAAAKALEVRPADIYPDLPAAYTRVIEGF